jgi:hypothetical protein
VRGELEKWLIIDIQRFSIAPCAAYCAVKRLETTLLGELLEPLRCCSNLPVRMGTG